MQEVIKKMDGLHVQEVLKKEGNLFLLRRDYKFIVPLKHLEEVLLFLKDDFFYSYCDDDFIFKYHNVYFDTEDYLFFNLHRQGKYNRIKIRSREYKNGVCNKFIECKKKVRGTDTKKEREEFSQNDSDPTPLKYDFVINNLKKFNLKPSDLRRKTEIFYNRLNLLSRDFKSRVTIDFDIFTKNEKSTSLKILPNHFVLEIKSRSFPKEIVSFLRQNYKIREESFSKYCISVCLLEKTVKKNRWKPILKKYF